MLQLLLQAYEQKKQREYDPYHATREARPEVVAMLQLRLPLTEALINEIRDTEVRAMPQSLLDCAVDDANTQLLQQRRQQQQASAAATSATHAAAPLLEEAIDPLFLPTWCTCMARRFQSASSLHGGE